MRMSRNQVIFLLVVVIGGLVALYAFQRLRFRLVRVEPQGKTSSVSSIAFSFNRSLDESAETKFTIQPRVPGSVTVKDKTVTFTPTQSYQLNTTYTAIIEEVTAQDGSKLRNLATIFTPTYIAENKLSKADQERQEALTDPLDRQTGILSKLPYSTLEFKVDYDLTIDEKQEKEIILRVTLFAILNRADQLPEYKRQIAEYKHKALVWIEQNSEGKVYNVTFEPDVPSEQEPDEHTGDGVPPEEQPH